MKTKDDLLYELQLIVYELFTCMDFSEFVQHVFTCWFQCQFWADDNDRCYVGDLELHNG